MMLITERDGDESPDKGSLLVSCAYPWSFLARHVTSANHLSVPRACVYVLRVPSSGLTGRHPSLQYGLSCLRQNLTPFAILSLFQVGYIG